MYTSQKTEANLIVVAALAIQLAALILIGWR